LGEKVFFLTGTDEHGTKIEKAARENGKEPSAYVDEMVPKFKELWKLLGIQYDFFIRTTDGEHKRAVQSILKDLEVRGEIYKADYTGWYCTPCESFWTKLQLAEGKCPDCRREVQELSEENYFFKLSKHQKWLVDYIEADPGFIQPDIRRNEVLGFLRKPLEDLCITRPRARLAWGIDYPASKEHVVYVWFDALINYASAAKFENVRGTFGEIWPADVHVVGKDILRQHAVYWPIMLNACGVQMPKKILAHGWWTMAGAKVSKSCGNIVDPVELVKKYGVDAFRYFLLREVTLGLDGAFSEDLLAERYTSDLANDFGNLWFRFASMLGKYCEGKIPDSLLSEDERTEMSAPFRPLWEGVCRAMLVYDPRTALGHIWYVVTEANKYIEDRKPWVLAKDPSKREALNKFLTVLAESLAHVGVILLPFIPETAKKILERLKLKTEWVIQSGSEFEASFLQPGSAVERGAALFPRLEQ
jgi:methionyl-tRNA synthetase